MTLSRTALHALITELWGPTAQIIGPEYDCGIVVTEAGLRAQRHAELTEPLDCGHVRTPELGPISFHTTGVKLFNQVARDAQGRSHCYACAEARERQTFLDSGGTAGVVYLGRDLTTVRTWTGAVLAQCVTRPTGRFKDGDATYAVTLSAPRRLRGTAAAGHALTLQAA